MIQAPDARAPGFFVSSTALTRDPSLPESDPDRFFDASAIPYQAFNGWMLSAGAVHVNKGDFGLVIDPLTSVTSGFVLADAGAGFAWLLDEILVLLEIDVQGARLIRERAPDAVLVFITPPSREELERRLRERGTEDPQELTQRLRVAFDEELPQQAWFDHVVENDDLERAADEVLAIIESHRK